MKKTFYGLQIVYKREQNLSNPHKWYYVASCDTYVNVHHAFKRLDPYDNTKSFFTDGHNRKTTCPDSTKTLK
ncbi:unnamed protein product, partial [Rotaria sp. Silwood2]